MWKTGVPSSPHRQPGPYLPSSSPLQSTPGGWLLTSFASLRPSFFLPLMSTLDRVGMTLFPPYRASFLQTHGCSPTVHAATMCPSQVFGPLTSRNRLFSFLIMCPFSATVSTYLLLLHLWDVTVLIIFVKYLSMKCKPGRDGAAWAAAWVQGGHEHVTRWALGTLGLWEDFITALRVCVFTVG